MIPGSKVLALIETHMHLDEPDFDADREAILDAARATGVQRFINIGYKPDRWHSSRALRERHADVDVALGVHPLEANSFDGATESALVSALNETKPVAVGEIGFDFLRSSPSFRDQERAFRAQLQIAIAAGLPVIIHQRGASDALIAELDRWPSLERIVLHSFDGTNRLTSWAWERGCFIGIGGLAAKPSSEPLRAMLAMLPIDRLLLETDAPYLAPPGSPSRRNTPVHLATIARLLAPLWGLTDEELSAQTTANAMAVFWEAAHASSPQAKLSP